MTKYKFAHRDHFLALAREAEKSNRNRQVDFDKMYDILDPEGYNIVAYSMLHNDVEMRTLWLLKQKDSMTPIEVWLDISFAHFNSLPEVETPAEEKEGEKQ